MIDMDTDYFWESVKADGLTLASPPEVRAAAGARFFRSIPIDWTTGVNPDALDMGDPDNCMGGQLYGSYEEALEALGLTSGQGALLGLNCNQQHDVDGVCEYPALTAAWRELVAAETSTTV